MTEPALIFLVFMQLFQWKHFNLENVEMKNLNLNLKLFLMYKLIHPDAPVHAVRHETLMKCCRCMDAENG